ncbi:hypothetical protein [Nocardioides plantarum]|uniref:Uncharacterized protein n=1 Tax=Nocardioides plantarum TaxID=29299 RepID=A0ABV5K416_9ACTN|nr:hypothetical protein [Nocardioides plantarum]
MSATDDLFTEEAQTELRRILAEEPTALATFHSFLAARESLIEMVASRAGGQLVQSTADGGNSLVDEVVARAGDLGVALESEHIGEFLTSGGHQLSTLAAPS